LIRIFINEKRKTKDKPNQMVQHFSEGKTVEKGGVVGWLRNSSHP